MKGGGAGGGASESRAVTDINMHFNGDFHAVSSAHNLLAALVDNRLHHGTASGLDPRRVTWKRVVDMNDRALRDIVIGLGGRTEGIPRETGFDITAASEVMAVLCLADGIADLKARLGRIVVGYRARTARRSPRTTWARSAPWRRCCRDAIKPNLVQTTEGVPAFVHGGPFANIAHGTNTITATKAALAYADIVVTEAGLRVRARRREVLRHQLPLRRLRAGLHGAGGDDPRAQDARRQAARGNERARRAPP